MSQKKFNVKTNIKMDLNLCPLPDEIPDIAKPECPFRIDQMVAMIVQRRQAAAPFANADALKSLANWATFFLANDLTKAVITPIITSWTFPPSERLIQGGNDNSTFNGIPEYNGEGSVTATGMMKNLEPTVAKALRGLSPFGLASAIGVSELTVYFVNKNGQIFHNALKGFPVYNFAIGTRGSEGFNASDMTPITIDLPPYWDEDMASVTPDFNPLIELSNSMVDPTP